MCSPSTKKVRHSIPSQTTSHFFPENSGKLFSIMSHIQKGTLGEEASLKKHYMFVGEILKYSRNNIAVSRLHGLQMVYQFIIPVYQFIHIIIWFAVRTDSSHLKNVQSYSAD